MKLYVVRHGETLENSNNCLCGRINSGLTEKGKLQALEVREYFKNKNIDLIVSSPLDRCKETSMILADNKISIIYSDKLLGRDHGEFTGMHKSLIDFDEYWNYNKNVQKGLLGAILMWYLYDEVNYVVGNIIFNSETFIRYNNFWGRGYIYMSIATMVLFAALFVNHFIINS